MALSWHHACVALRRDAAGPPSARTVFRPTFVRALSVVIWGLMLVFAVLALSEGWSLALRAAPALLLVCALTYALFWRPCVEVDDDGVTLRNVLRDVRVPFAAIDSIDTRFALTLYSAGRRDAAWAAPAPGRSTLMGLGRWDLSGVRHILGTDVGEGPISSAAPNSDSGGAALLVRQGWERWRASHPGDAPSAVTVRWDVPLVVLLLAGAALVVGDVLVR